MSPFQLILNISMLWLVTGTNAQEQQQCLNDNDFREAGKPKVTCQYIRKNERRRQEKCKLTDVRASCPQACGLCCEDEKSFKFKTRDGSDDYKDRKSCWWLSKKKKRQDLYCGTYNSGRMVKDACPSACDKCLPEVLRKKPNIMVILADDVGTGDIPVYWDSSSVHMPNIDKLAQMGVTFRDAHSSPLCAPSRYMLLSGNYQHRGRHYNGHWNLDYENNQFHSHQKSIAEVLRDLGGYHTAVFGKWHLGAKIPPHGIKNQTHILSSPSHDWSQPLIDGPQTIGFDKSYITTAGIQDAPYSFFRDGYLSTNKATDLSFWHVGEYDMPLGTSIISKPGEGDKGWDSTAYNQILVNETQKFIDDHVQNRPEDPFFTYVALGSVHTPHSPPDKYVDGSPIKGEYPTAHMDVLYELDKVVGSLVSTVENNGLASDTIIIFTSDNGGLKWSSNFFHHSSGPLRGHKGQIWEGGHRVPMIMRHPLFPAGEKRHQLVGLNDLYATICELVGIEIPKGSAEDSVSFAKLLQKNDNGNNHNNLLYNIRTSLATWDYNDGILQAESIRSNNLKLVRHFNVNNPPKIEMYDLGIDISEAKDISKFIPQHMKHKMLSELKKIGPCPDDHEGSFKLLQQDVTCSFFRHNKDRCIRYAEGASKCNSICGHHKAMCRDTFESTKQYTRMHEQE